MTKAKLQNGTPVQPYPYTLHDLLAAHKGTSFPKENGSPIWPANLDTFNVVDVVEVAPPTPTATQSVAEALPVLVAGVWTQQWTLRDWTAQEIADALAQAKQKMIRKIDTDTDALFDDVIGNRAQEYVLAEQEAKAYRDAGYAGAVPESVSSWATAKSQSATWAADDILATAAGWRTAQRAIRANRLLRKEQTRTAASQAALATVSAQWSGFLSAVRSQLGV